MPSAPEDSRDLLGDLVRALLSSAMCVSYTIGRLDELDVTLVRSDDPVALTQIADAIALLKWSRQQLINHADHLDDRSSGL